MPASPATTQKLIQIPICKGLTVTEAEQILSIAEEQSVGRSGVVFREGDAGDGVYVVLEGTMEVTKRDRQGKEQSIAKLSDGTVVGEMSLVSGDAARSATVVATSDARLLKISSSKFQALLQRDSVAALKMVNNLAQVMSRRMLLMNEKVVELMEKGTRKEELADFQKVLANWAF
ncbi:MAG TPA: cyclic nucleotide-binding domain-containing protein [Myxococcales bacterium]|nr:cyclic nucleotide-binding domain-containing protein [Myxococcales bacterium]